jgi:hypothetical protein
VAHRSPLRPFHLLERRQEPPPQNLAEVARPPAQRPQLLLCRRTGWQSE